MLDLSFLAAGSFEGPGELEDLVFSDMRCLKDRGSFGLRAVASSGLINAYSAYLVSTAIGLGKYCIPSDLQSQAKYRLVSTTVGDHVGILGAVVFVFGGGVKGRGRFLLSTSEKS